MKAATHRTCARYAAPLSDVSTQGSICPQHHRLPRSLKRRSILPLRPARSTGCVSAADLLQKVMSRRIRVRYAVLPKIYLCRVKMFDQKQAVGNKQFGITPGTVSPVLRRHVRRTPVRKALFFRLSQGEDTAQ